jgi:hypothetical protein
VKKTAARKEAAAGKKQNHQVLPMRWKENYSFCIFVGSQTKFDIFQHG